MKSSRKRRRPHQPAWRKLLAPLDEIGEPASPAFAEQSIAPLYVLEPQASPIHRTIRLATYGRLLRKNGARGSLHPLPLDEFTAAQLQSDTDRLVCRLLKGMPSAETKALDGAVASVGRSAWSLDGDSLQVLLNSLVTTGRLFVRHADTQALHRLERGPAPGWELCLVVSPSGNGFEMQMQIARLEDIRPAGSAALILPGAPGLCIVDNVIYDFDALGCAMTPALMETAARVRKGDLSKLEAELTGLTTPPRLALPDASALPYVRDEHPSGQLHVSVDDDRMIGTVTFVYDGIHVPSARRSGNVIDLEWRRQILRNRREEAALVRDLFAVGFEETGARGEFEIDANRLPDVVAALSSSGWEVYGEGRPFRRAGPMSVRVSSGIDWLELSGTMDFDGIPLELPELLRALRGGRRFVRLGDGSMGLLPETWLRRCDLLLELGNEEGQALRFRRSQALLLNELLSEAPEVEWDESVGRLRETIRDFSGLAPLPEPAGFVGTLRPYQCVGLAWFGLLDELGWGGCLADDMGLGKTIQVLALLISRAARDDAGPSLVVVPRSVVFNWLDEAQRFVPTLKVAAYHGPNRHRLLPRFDALDLIVTTYHTLRNDISDFAKRQFDYVVLDEAQAVKNPRSQASRAVRLLKARHRLALTGTPVENHLGDLWSLLEFLNPGMLGAASAFRGAFTDADHTNGESRELLRRALRPFILRRTKEDVAPELPPRVEETIYCEMTEVQARRYAELRSYYRASVFEHVRADGLQRSGMHVLEALLRLRQAACHPALLDERVGLMQSGKFDALLPMLAEVIEGGHKALIFSQFTSFLALVRRLLDEAGHVYEYMDGKTRDRRARVARFQDDPSCPLFLISLKAGGLGLNLTAADYVFILDPWWNPATEAQAIDRAHRIGQDKKVIAYRLIARESVEEKILELQGRKRRLADAIITESPGVLAGLTRADLELLLS